LKLQLVSRFEFSPDPQVEQQQVLLPGQVIDLKVNRNKGFQQIKIKDRSGVLLHLADWTAGVDYDEAEAPQNDDDDDDEVTARTSGVVPNNDLKFLSALSASMGLAASRK
jgi:hypothetical protein